MARMEPIATDKIKGFYSYLESLDWSEPWLYCLASVYLILLVVIWRTRKAGLVQIAIFFTMLGLVYNAEYLNIYLSKNHKFFTEHQYFDSPGMFISVVMSLPLLFLSCVVVGLWFYETVALMTEVRSLKVSKMKKAEKKKGTDEEEEEAGKDSSAASSPSPSSRSSRRRRTAVKKED